VSGIDKLWEGRNVAPVKEKKGGGVGVKERDPDSVLNGD